MFSLDWKQLKAGRSWDSGEMGERCDVRAAASAGGVDKFIRYLLLNCIALDSLSVCFLIFKPCYRCLSTRTKLVIHSRRSDFVV